MAMPSRSEDDRYARGDRLERGGLLKNTSDAIEQIGTCDTIEANGAREMVRARRTTE